MFAMTRDTKEVECSGGCGVLTTVNLPRLNYHRGKRFLCGFCTASDSKEKENQIKQLTQKVNTEVAKLEKLFEDIKTSLDALKTDLVSDDPVPQHKHQTDNKRNIVVMGVPEEENKDGKERAEKELSMISDTMKAIGIHESPETLITDYRRLGRYQGKDKKRPLLLVCGTIWTKRRLMNAFQQNRSLLTVRFKNDIELTEERKALLAEVRQKNKEEKDKAGEEDREVEKSFSLTDDGKIVQYVKQGGRWIKGDGLTQED